MTSKETSASPRLLSANLFETSQEELRDWEEKVFAPDAALSLQEADRLTYLCTFCLRKLRYAKDIPAAEAEIIEILTERFNLSAKFCQRIARGGMALLDRYTDISGDVKQAPNYSALGPLLICAGLIVAPNIGIHFATESNAWFESWIAKGYLVLSLLMIPVFLMSAWVQLTPSFQLRSGKERLRQTEVMVLYLRSHSDEGQRISSTSDILGMGTASVEQAVVNKVLWQESAMAGQALTSTTTLPFT